VVGGGGDLFVLSQKSLLSRFLKPSVAPSTTSFSQPSSAPLVAVGARARSEAMCSAVSPVVAADAVYAAVEGDVVGSSRCCAARGNTT
jgi:hypothetical protein